MTEESGQVGVAQAAVLVFDTSPLSCFARAGRLEMLGALVTGHRAVVTFAVLDELGHGAREHPDLSTVAKAPWLEPVRVDTLRGLQLFVEYARILGVGRRNVGEASTLAWAEEHGAIAVLDEQAAVNCARSRGVGVRRTLALIAAGIRAKSLSSSDAAVLVDGLVAGGAWLPCDGSTFVKWAQERGLI